MSKSSINDKSKNKQSKKYVTNNTVKLLPIACYDDINDCFVYKNGEAVDLLKFTTKNLLNASDDEIEGDIFKITGYLRTTLLDLKIIALNFAVNTQSQQEYIKHKIEMCNKDIFRDMLKQKLKELQTIAKTKTQREYYLMIFSASRETINDDRVKALQSMSGLIDTIKKEKKIQVLKRINNKARGEF